MATGLLESPPAQAPGRDIHRATDLPHPVGRRSGPLPVLLADPDPISRDVLARILGAAPRICLVAAVDPATEPEGLFPQVRVAVLCPGSRDDIEHEIRVLRSRGIGVVVLAPRWTRTDVRKALAAGAGACLVKEPNAPGLVDAVVALDAGHRVLAPDLLTTLVDPAGHGPGADPGAVGRVSRLSPREREVLAVLAEGNDTEQAARQLCVSTATVKSHVSHALTKLGVRNRLEAVLLLRSVLG